MGWYEGGAAFGAVVFSGTGPAAIAAGFVFEVGGGVIGFWAADNAADNIYSNDD